MTTETKPSPKSGHPLYNIWRRMLYRCQDKFNYNYGGRGITVDERWHKFENFVEDMGPRPPGTTLDRERVNEGYSKSNCRWVTPKQQSANQRSRMAARHCRELMRLVRAIEQEKEKEKPAQITLL